MKIVLADHHPQALFALKTMLQENSKLEVIGEALDAYKLLTMVMEKCPDLILMDSELPGMSNTHLITELHKIQPKPNVVVLGTNPEQGRMLVKAGADAFVSKSDPPDWVLATLQNFESHANNFVA
jgi:DNA-binding NarL/FixJ family response regulator